MFICIRWLKITLLAILGLLLSQGLLPGQKEHLQRPTITEIEERLLELVNLARAGQNREPLRSSSFLRDIARAHSQDMAKGGHLSHLSTSGETYTERLVRQDVLFGPHGENVAFSQTFSAEIIHQSLMDSPEHRDNILKSEFDTVGIGVFFQPDKGYYITQDFIRPLITEYQVYRKDRLGERHPFLPDEELLTNLAQVKKQAKNALNQIRESLSLTDFDFIPEADRLADRFSRSKAEGRSLPTTPPKYTVVPILYLFVTAPSLEKVLPEIHSIDHAHYHSGGLGISFGRNKDHPGGAYFFTFMLIKDSPYRSQKPADWRNIWLDFINNARNKRNLGKLRENSELSQSAGAISTQAQKRRPIPLSPSFSAYTIRTYTTDDLTRFPEDLERALISSRIVELGLGIDYQPHPELPAGSFWITVIYR